MSIWTRISDAISALTAGESLSAVFEKLRAAPDMSVAFTIAVIALGAKMAKADGQVTRDEVTAFKEVFHIAPKDEPQAARVFNLARQDVAGFEDYARSIKRMYGEDDAPLCDLMEGLFHIAMADGVYHPQENEFLRDVADAFGFDERRFVRIRAQFVPDAQRDPYDVLGVDATAPMDVVRAAWRRLVRETHPDQLTARGLPEEAIKLAQARLVAVNEAWEQITQERQSETA
ncbi:molecular chaperone DjiA [Yoonia sp. 208BN28-4]|uniref:molecular chaperone DjiA n=1 Tax=Yoonia sp. 208BN28-4 TaxID=3126505 RepID=UPI0030A0B812